MRSQRIVGSMVSAGTDYPVLDGGRVPFAFSRADERTDVNDPGVSQGTAVPAGSEGYSPMSASRNAEQIVWGQKELITRGDRAVLYPLAVTVEEGARMLGISRATMYKHVKRGEIDSFTIGRSRRIAISVLERFVQGTAGYQRDS